MRLTTKKQWENRWVNYSASIDSLDPNKPVFRERHKLFKKFIPKAENETMIEVGAYPGTFLNYFYKYFGYKPWGVEYVERCANHATEMLRNSDIPATIICKDIFELNPNDFMEQGGWDLTVSFGFVEHFTDPTEAITKHVEITRPGGLIVISIPNHAGINGWITRKLDYEIWKQHNLMSLKDLKKIVKNEDDTNIVYSGYVGHVGFWSSNLSGFLLSKFGKAYPIIRTPLWLLENLGQWVIPNNRWTSPDSLVILRKK